MDTRFSIPVTRLWILDPRRTSSLFATTFIAALLLGLVFVTSCAHHKLDPEYAGPAERPVELLEYYSYPQQPIEAKVETIGEKCRYTINGVEFPSVVNVFGTDSIKVDYYVQKKHGKFPTVLALPIAGGIDFCIETFARHYASNGFNVAVVHNRSVDLEDIESAEQAEDYLKQVVLDCRQVLDFLVEQDKVDSNRLGCLGLSLGGIKASIVSAVDERIKCTVVGLAGGSMADIALESKDRDIRNYISGWVEMGVSAETLRIELSDKLITDPVALGKYADARNFLMYIAAFDQIVPKKCGDNLWRAVGKPEMVYLFSGHFTSLLYLPFVERNSLSFFKRRFDAQKTLTAGR